MTISSKIIRSIAHTRRAIPLRWHSMRLHAGAAGPYRPADITSSRGYSRLISESSGRETGPEAISAGYWILALLFPDVLPASGIGAWQPYRLLD